MNLCPKGAFPLGRCDEHSDGSCVSSELISTSHLSESISMSRQLCLYNVNEMDHQ